MRKIPSRNWGGFAPIRVRTIRVRTTLIKFSFSVRTWKVWCKLGRCELEWEPSLLLPPQVLPYSADWIMQQSTERHSHIPHSSGNGQSKVDITSLFIYLFIGGGHTTMPFLGQNKIHWKLIFAFFGPSWTSNYYAILYLYHYMLYFVSTDNQNTYFSHFMIKSHLNFRLNNPYDGV